MKQTAVEETKAVFGPIKKRINDAVSKLEEQIAISEGAGVSETELEQAKNVLNQARGPQTGGP